ncbi:phosphoribosylaminoimidazolesuccinocarboxamide synthase [Candidatus Methanomassiliicoccus intestinalis]|uniref:phosphoribosylaminoimidazolesuccinocarboxamide synthase n=1 Tax=Candidatus Methanomassiliicoccus intestinalis TaxID=1406512 RepID=UPI0037DD15B0
MNLLRTGKVKQVYEVDDDTLEFVFTDNISVFDKIIPSNIPCKGETLCRTAAFWFQVCRKAGIKTHFTELIPPNRMRVKRVDVIEDMSKINTSTVNYLIPLEFISRQYVAGSLFDRVRSGEISPKDLGFDENHEVKYGEKLPKPYYETTTKLEKVDRLLTREEALKISGLTEAELDHVFELVAKIDEIIDSEVGERMLIHVDGKKEFAMDAQRNIMLIDTFGTSDEDRWWDEDAYAAGECVELSKEAVRQYYRETGYFDELMAARKKGIPEPDIPALSEEWIKKVQDLYIEMFERLTGESFR